MIRACPVCKLPLIEKNLHGEIVDRWESCNGIFFDRRELESLVPLVRLYQQSDIDEDDLESHADIESDRVLPCPADGARLEKRDIAGLFPFFGSPLHLPNKGDRIAVFFVNVAQVV